MLIACQMSPLNQYRLQQLWDFICHISWCRTDEYKISVNLSGSDPVYLRILQDVDVINKVTRSLRAGEH